MTGPVWRPAVALALVLAVLAAGWVAWQRYQERYVVTAPEQSPGGPAVTQLITAQLSGTRQLRVAQLAGTIQATASDVRGLGWLRSDQVVKMPYAVDYFVDLSGVGAGDMEWHPETRTLIVDAPDVTVGTPNTEEGRRTLVRTTGLFVTRAAAEELSRRTSLNAAAKAQSEAQSPERMAQAREHARRGLAATFSAPLAALGYRDARVVVTFPPERGARSAERWDQSRHPSEVLGTAR
jgi:hypothetical protein